MNNWRDQLNRLAVEFWCGVGNLAELLVWAETANKEMGEVHSEIWDLYSSPTDEQVIGLLLKISSEVNGFSPESWDAEPYVVSAFNKALDLFLAQRFSPQKICALVEKLDSVFNIGLRNASRPVSSSWPKLEWLGNLWNCCDWCDGMWTFENSSPLVLEARRISEMLKNSQGPQLIGAQALGIDWVDVSRVAHQLGLDHGPRAHIYAEKLAKDAKQRLQIEDDEFWSAVAAALRPRNPGDTGP